MYCDESLCRDALTGAWELHFRIANGQVDRVAKEVVQLSVADSVHRE